MNSLSMTNLYGMGNLYDMDNLYDMTPTDAEFKNNRIRTWMQDKEPKYRCQCCDRKLDVSNVAQMRTGFCSKKCLYE